MQIGYRSAGRHLVVAVHRQGPGRFAVSVDGHTHAVDMAALDGSTLQLQRDGTLETAHVVRVGGGVHVWIGGEVHVLTPESTATAADHGALAPPHIVTPMPGKVLQVLVEVGQRVEMGDGLVIVEAMKMEHRIAAAAAATVRAVHVTDGEMIDGGAVLVELDYG